MGAALALWLSGCGEKIHKFEGVEGPLSESELLQPVKERPENYNNGESSRLAIWLTDENSNWVALLSGLKTIGIPFRITKDYKEALSHNVVLTYPYISGRDLPSDSFSALRGFVEGGGTLIGTNVLGGGMQDMFGFEAVTESKERAFLALSDDFKETTDFGKKGLTALKIGSETDSSLNPGTNSYSLTTGSAIARYENGAAAITVHNYGKGRTYAWGVDLGQLLAKGYNRRQVDITDSYANRYRPTLDALLILLQNIYQQNQPGAVTLGTVPDGKKLSFILSHDVDYSKSLKNAIPYTEHQKSEGVVATYFIQTKYMEDYNDKIFLDEAGAAQVTQIESLGGEIASHSVSHAVDLWQFPFGDGTEKYPDYRPFVQTAEKTRNGTIMGELRVSKFLLENFAKTQDVVSFRPGFLSNPDEMPQGLASAGFKNSSSTTANISLTHFPFRLTYGRGFDSFTPVYEFPITIEDELPPDMITRLDEAKRVAQNIAKIGGLYVVLIHTDAVDTRLDFQKGIIDEVRPYAWMGPLREFGEWWRARDQVDVDLNFNGDKTEILLNAPTVIAGLTLEMQKCHDIIETSGLEISCDNGNYLLGPTSGQHKIVLQP